jgi:[ribosomal protein S18]-alanine N-acetyltransferase
MSPRATPMNTAAQAGFEPLLADRLDEVLRVEQRAYDHPWNHANFVDALQSGYQAQMLVADGYVLGYFVAMKGVDEVHLLNITVAPEFQGQGWSRVMLDALALWTRGQGKQWLWLEARVSNVRALHVYERYGFRRVGQRKAYYPAGNGRREDAIVMSLPLPEST